MRTGSEAELGVGDQGGSLVGEVLEAGGLTSGDQGPVGDGRLAHQSHRGCRGVTADVTIATEDRLGILFRGIQAEEVGDVLVATGSGDEVAGAADDVQPVGRIDRAGSGVAGLLAVRGADHDLGRGELVGDGREVSPGPGPLTHLTLPKILRVYILAGGVR